MGQHPKGSRWPASLGVGPRPPKDQTDLHKCCIFSNPWGNTDFDNLKQPLFAQLVTRLVLRVAWVTPAKGKSYMQCWSWMQRDTSFAPNSPCYVVFTAQPISCMNHPKKCLIQVLPKILISFTPSKTERSKPICNLDGSAGGILWIESENLCNLNVYALDIDNLEIQLQ